VFIKPDITSRNELDWVLPGDQHQRAALGTDH
jgi:hypothetical protein